MREFLISRRFLLWMLAVVLFAILVQYIFCGSKLVFNQGLTRAAAAPPGNATITVTGRGEVTAVPDSGRVSVGVTNQAVSARQAQLANDRMANAVVAAIKAQGIPKEKIRTSEYSIWPEQNEKGQIVRYRVSHSFAVEVSPLEKLGAVLDAAVEAGANHSCGISFERSDSAVLEREALKRAVADARERAGALAGAAGKSIVRVVSISDATTQPEPPLYRPAMKLVETAGSVPVEPGELTIEAAVQVVFEVNG
ncbi:MAG: SIMPL domain-containing protein [Firmicutes bacterium]|nr:SIMPL domain-containing protein [Bacillota bacterium]